MKKTKFSAFFILFLIIGVLCSSVLLFSRIKAELSSDSVAFAVHYKTVETLSNETDKPHIEIMGELYNAGIRFFIIDDENEAKYRNTAEKIGFKIARSGAAAKKGDAFLTPLLKEDNATAVELEFFAPSVPLAVIENADRTDVIMPDGFDPETTSRPMVKTMYMYNAYSYHYQFSEPATENENILFRGISERGLRLVIFTPLVNEQKEIVTDISAYSDIIFGLKTRLEDRGITVGDSFSTLPAPRFNTPLFIGALLLLCCAVVYFISKFIILSSLFQNILLLFGAAVSVLGTLFYAPLMQKLAAFGAATLFGVFAAFLLEKLFLNQKEKNLALDFALSLLYLVLLGVAGGLYVSALLCSRSYMFGFNVFFGVKASNLLLIAFTGCWLTYVMFNKKAREQNKNTNKIPLLLVVIMGVCVALALIILVLRSGDNMLPVANVEKNMRNALEYYLFARPRTKEMLVAFPALALYIVAAKKRYSVIALALGVLASIGASSVINTFCHTFTPVHVSLIRTGIGALIGFVISIPLMYLFFLILNKKPNK